MQTVRTLRTPAGRAQRRAPADLHRESLLLGMLRISPVESWQASTPALRRLLVRARVATVRSALTEEGLPTAPRPLWPPTVAAMACGARDALLEAILAPLASASPDRRPDARRRLRLAMALVRIPVTTRAAWRTVERLGRRVPPDLRHAWAVAVCALLRVDAEGWRRAAEHLLPAMILSEIDPEAPCDWRALQILHVRARRSRPDAALRIAALLSCCEALRVRRLHIRESTAEPLILPTRR